MDKIIESIILGLIQGFSEFLPISSSAHLNLFPWLFNWTEISASFDVALHIGTLLALCVYFFKDGIALIKGGLCQAILFFTKKSKKYKAKEEDKIQGKIFWFIIAATIPAGILSLVLDKVSEKIVGENKNVEMIMIAIASIVMGILLYIVDKKFSDNKKFDDITLKDTMLIGASQALAAAFPGVSRSGVTITTSRALKYDRQSAAKVSFLLSVPIVLAAVLFKLKDFDLTYPVPFFLGIITSFVSGLFVINILMKFLKEGKYEVFAIYRVCFGIFIIIATLIKGM